MTPITSKTLVIDDDKVHLMGLANGLDRHGMTCLPIHFAGESTTIHACPDVRIIFADLHLSAGGLSTDFSTIGHLLEDAIKPAGPYCILLWTRYPDQAEGSSDVPATSPERSEAGGRPCVGQGGSPRRRRHRPG